MSGHKCARRVKEMFNFAVLIKVPCEFGKDSSRAQVGDVDVREALCSGVCAL